jgi:sirohydrochlorin cobaltochelatase
MLTDVNDKRAPMASAPLKYLSDGSVDWGNMWDTFCVLALDGGPPHRGTMLCAQEEVDTQSEGYRFALNEIIRGIKLVSGLEAAPASLGWVRVQCVSVSMARWLAEAINEENVQAWAQDRQLFVPVGDYFSLKGEIKNVITAVAKTSHYWQEHLPAEVKQTLTAQIKIEQLRRQLKHWAPPRWLGALLLNR